MINVIDVTDCDNQKDGVSLVVVPGFVLEWSAAWDKKDELKLLSHEPADESPVLRLHFVFILLSALVRSTTRQLLAELLDERVGTT